MPFGPNDCSIPDARVPLILAGNVFVVVDDGAAVVTDYPIMERIVAKAGESHPQGLGCVVVVLAGARPPNDEIRAAMRDAFAAVGKHLASVCWMVDASGFKGAAARAVLSGLRLLLRPPYPTHITDDLRDALSWSYTRVGARNAVQFEAIVARVDELRHEVSAGLPGRASVRA